MNNKGFTMIELLAVVTILSIILLVSFPALINMTRSDKEREYKDLANTLCKAGETYIYNNKELYPELGTSGEEFYIRVASLIDEELVNKSQTNPKNGKSINQNLLKYKVKGDKTLSCSYLERSLATLVNDTGESGLSIGDKYSYEVKSGTKYNFYVLSFNSDDTVNLIMDRNICEDGTTNYTEDNDYCRVSWYGNASDNSYGPVTVMGAMYEATKNWTNIPSMDFEYNDIADSTSSGYTGSTTYGYTGVTVTNGVATITGKDVSNVFTIGTNEKPLKARLPKLKELKDNGCSLFQATDDDPLGTCAWWLVDNMKEPPAGYYTNANINYNPNIVSYWTLASYPNEVSKVRIIFHQGYIDNKEDPKIDLTLDEDGVPIDRGLGMRPVITVPKSDFED